MIWGYWYHHFRKPPCSNSEGCYPSWEENESYKKQELSGIIRFTTGFQSHRNIREHQQLFMTKGIRNHKDWTFRLGCVPSAAHGLDWFRPLEPFNHSNQYRVFHQNRHMAFKARFLSGREGLCHRRLTGDRPCGVKAEPQQWLWETLSRERFCEVIGVVSLRPFGFEMRQ